MLLLKEKVGEFNFLFFRSEKELKIGGINVKKKKRKFNKEKAKRIAKGIGKTSKVVGKSLFKAGTVIGGGLFKMGSAYNQSLKERPLFSSGGGYSGYQTQYSQKRFNQGSVQGEFNQPCRQAFSNAVRAVKFLSNYHSKDRILSELKREI